MTGVLIQRRDVGTETDMHKGRTPWRDGAVRLQTRERPKIASSHRQVRKRLGTDSPSQPWEEPACVHFGLNFDLQNLRENPFPLLKTCRLWDFAMAGSERIWGGKTWVGI